MAETLIVMIEKKYHLNISGQEKAPIWLRPF